MTLQTTHPLAESRLAERAWALSNFLLWEDRGRLDLSPPYQRGAVWGVTRQRMLIRSMIEGLPIGSIVVNDRASSPQTWWPDAATGKAPSFAVIDGKQRLETLFAWVAGDLTVPASWFPADEVCCYTGTEDGPYVDVDDLRGGVSRWENRPISTLEARVSTLEAEREIFDRINFGGVPQGESDAGSAA